MELTDQHKEKLFSLLNEIEDDTEQTYKLILVNLRSNKEVIINNQAIEVSNSTIELNGIHRSLHQLCQKAKALNIDLSYTNGKLYMEDNDGYEHEYGNYVYI